MCVNYTIIVLMHYCVAKKANWELLSYYYLEIQVKGKV